MSSSKSQISHKLDRFVVTISQVPQIWQPGYDCKSAQYLHQTSEKAVKIAIISKYKYFTKINLV